MPKDCQCGSQDQGQGLHCQSEGHRSGNLCIISDILVFADLRNSPLSALQMHCDDDYGDKMKGYSCLFIYFLKSSFGI